MKSFLLSYFIFSHFCAFSVFFFNSFFFPSFGSTLLPTHTPISLFSSTSLEVLHSTFLATFKILTCPFNLTKSKANWHIYLPSQQKDKIKMLEIVTNFTPHVIVFQDINFIFIFFNTTNWIILLISFTVNICLVLPVSPHGPLFGIFISQIFLLGFFSFSEEHHPDILLVQSLLEVKWFFVFVFV